MARTRLTGTQLSLLIDAKEYNLDVSEYEYSEEDKDSGTITFADAAGGSSSSGKLKCVFIQSLDAESLHQVLMDNPGKTDVAFDLAPFGNKAATTAQPHFKGKLNFPRLRPSLGIKAGDVDATSEVEFKVTSWEKVTA